MRELKKSEIDKLPNLGLKYLGIIDGSKKKVVYDCISHGLVSQRFDVHVKLKKCSKCSNKTELKYTKEYINSIKTRYDYIFDKNEYESFDKIKIVCKTHGLFSQRIHNHFILGQNCPSCSRIRLNKDLVNFLSKIDINIIKYNGYRSKSEFSCKEGHIIKSTVDNIKRHGCSVCRRESNLKIERLKFIQKSIMVWGELLDIDYSTLYYRGKRFKMILKTDIGDIEQLPDYHLMGFLPKKSTSEIIIKKILEKNQINYIREKTFNGCVNKKKLRFDFYLPDIKVCIEYNGIQHYESVDKFGGLDGLKYTQVNDDIKRNFCKVNNIELITIKYNESIIEKLKNIIC